MSPRNRAAAAQALGISRRALQYKLKQYGLLEEDRAAEEGNAAPVWNRRWKSEIRSREIRKKAEIRNPSRSKFHGPRDVVQPWKVAGLS